MAIQELDVKILHCTGRSNANADALSRAPIVEENKDTHAMVPFGIIAAINASRSTVQEDDLSNKQRNDPKLLELIKFLETGTLSANEKQARVLAMTKSQFHTEVKYRKYYTVLFVDYLTKWPEVFAVKDQNAATIVTLLVEQILNRHGVPTGILSDRGKAFLSELLKEVEKLLGFHKVNTTPYHLQTDGLVKRFNITLIAMLAKTTEKGGEN